MIGFHDIVYIFCFSRLKFSKNSRNVILRFIMCNLKRNVTSVNYSGKTTERKKMIAGASEKCISAFLWTSGFERLKLLSFTSKPVIGPFISEICQFCLFNIFCVFENSHQFTRYWLLFSTHSDWKEDGVLETSFGLVFLPCPKLAFFDIIRECRHTWTVKTHLDRYLFFHVFTVQT